MIRIVNSDLHGGSLPGRTLANGKRSSVPLQKGRNEVDQEDLDVALSIPSVKALFGTVLHLEPVAAPVQPPIPAPAPPKGKAADTKPETPSAKAGK